MPKIINFTAFLTISILCLAAYMILSSEKKEIVNEIILPKIISVRKEVEQDKKLNLLFAGDIFFDRHIDEQTRKQKALNYAHIFQGLKTLEREKYDAWIGNLECPVTEEQSSKYEKENYLKFSCKKEYLPELAKYFDIVSLANNHTNNMNEREGIEETRKHLKDAGIKYFGDYDNSEVEKVCEVIYIQDLPIAFCGFHGVYKLPTESEIKTINEYSKYFVTFVMPHQGVEYEFKSNTYQKKIYRAFIDNGADAVIGSHPHVIQEVETYKGKQIFYSLGNFIFDQSWIKTREHMAVHAELNFPSLRNNYKDLNCTNLTNTDCLKMAANLQIIKPKFTLKYKPVFTYSNMDFITKIRNLTETEYQKLLKTINFDKVASSSKI